MSQFTLDQIYIVLAEPSSAQQKIIGKHLSDVGINNRTWVRTGNAALASMRRDLPDVVISAMHLADMTGTELVQSMRADNSLQAIPFMLVSSETNYRYLEPICQAGVIAILPKPFDKEQLKKSLYATLDYFDPEQVELEKIDYEDFKVLIVDDSDTSRRHIKRLLHRMGLENITEAQNAIEGLRLVEHDYFNFIVTDYFMPEMDGKEFIERIREDSPQASAPILMVTSAANGESRLAGVRQAGVSAICDKQFEPKQIKQLSEKII